MSGPEGQSGRFNPPVWQWSQIPAFLGGSQRSEALTIALFDGQSDAQERHIKGPDAVLSCLTQAALNTFSNQP